MRKIGNILITLLTVLLALIAVFNVACYVKQKKTGDCCPTVLGLGMAVVMTGSMEDSISVNDLVVIYQTNDYHVGDVITFQGNSYPITHRIVSIQSDENGNQCYTTRGDANNTDDDEISADKIIGEVVLVIPRLGTLQAFMQTPKGFFTILGIFALLWICAELNAAIRRRR